MGKLIFKVVVMTAVFIGISNYILYVQTGKSPFDMASFMAGGSSDDSQAAMDKLLGKPAKPVKEEVYTWKDENGVTHFSKTKPLHMEEAEKLEVGENTNIMQSVPVNREKEAPKTKVNTENIGYSPSNVQNLMKDAQNIEKLLQERYEEQTKAIDSN